MARKLPIGIQSFEKIRRDGFVYIDKAAYVYELVRAGVPCFLRRPWRFGKSLLVDECDKPLLEAMESPALEERNRATLKGLYSVLKDADEHIRYAHVPGGPHEGSGAVRQSDSHVALFSRWIDGGMGADRASCVFAFGFLDAADREAVARFR